MRSRAKAVNFGIVYGIGAFSLSQDIGVSVAEACLLYTSSRMVEAPDAAPIGMRPSRDRLQRRKNRKRLRRKSHPVP